MHCWSFIFVVFDGLTRKLRTTIWLRVVRFVVISVSSAKEHESDGLQYEKLRSIVQLLASRLSGSTLHILLIFSNNTPILAPIFG